MRDTYHEGRLMQGVYTPRVSITLSLIQGHSGSAEEYIQQLSKQ